MVIRNSSLQQISAIDIVPGDIVVLRLGDRIPADGRVIQCTDLKVDNSSLTGESDPQERNLSHDIQNILEASNMVFSGSTVMSGEGVAIIFKTGDESILGKIANLTVASKKRESQLTIETEVFVRRTALVAFFTAVIFFVFGIVSNYGIGITFSFAIGTFVAFIPQGLPVTVTLLLTIAAKRLSKKNVLVKDLQAVETLGAITALATDKTGTLTQNKMTVVSAWINNMIHSPGLEKSAGYVVPQETANLNSLLNVCALCAKSKLDPKEDDLPFEQRQIYGDATEVGLIRFASMYMDVPGAMATHGKAFEIPFNSTNKWHLTITRMEHENGDLILMVKGAPERVKKMCKYIQLADSVEDWSEKCDAAFDEAYKNFASKGRRVLAFAHVKLPRDKFPEDFAFSQSPLNFPKDEFVFLGLIGLMDPPKHGVRKAVAALRTAGIQVIMVTGDHPLTAEAIAKNIGLIQGQTALDAAVKLQKPVEYVTDDEYDAVVVHGDEIDQWEDSDWDCVLCKMDIVFAR